MSNLIKTKLAIISALLAILAITGCTTTSRYYGTTNLVYTGSLPYDFNNDFPLPYTGYPLSYYSSVPLTPGNYCCHHYRPYFNDGLIVQRYYYDW